MQGGGGQFGFGGCNEGVARGSCRGKGNLGVGKVLLGVKKERGERGRKGNGRKLHT